MKTSQKPHSNRMGQNNGSYRHGMSHTKFYKNYKAILDRCTRKKSNSYPMYGGRGIKCHWNTFEEFRNDMYPTYQEGLTIERINNDGDYCKENCRWATALEQANNRRSNKFIVYNGERKTIAEWGRATGISAKLILGRINSGWTIERALTTKDKTRAVPIQTAIIKLLKLQRRWVTSNFINSHLENFTNVCYLRKILANLAKEGTLVRRSQTIAGAKGVAYYEYKLNNK